jgi:hypothetical protein
MSSATIGALINECDVQHDHAEQRGREMRARSIDPAIIDPAAKSVAEDAEHVAQRYRVAIERLQGLRNVATHKESVIAWRPQFDIVDAETAALATELKERYPDAVSWIVDFLKRKAVNDEAVTRINLSAPQGEIKRLFDSELRARGINAYGNSEPIAKQLRLPVLVEGDGPSVLLWPPATLPVSLSISGMFPANGMQQTKSAVREFAMRDGEVVALDADGNVIDIALPPLAGPPPPVRDLREQALAAQAERRTVYEKANAAAEAREIEYQARVNRERIALHEADQARRREVYGHGPV